MGTVYTSLGLYDQAAKLLRSALDKRRAALWRKAPGSRASMDRLGEVLKLSAQYETAEKLYRGALTIRREMLGNGTSTTARASMSSPTFSAAGAIPASRSSFSAKALALRKKMLRSAVPTSRRA